MMSTQQRAKQESPDASRPPESTLTAPFLLIEGEMTADTRAVCRSYIAGCLGDTNLIERERQYRAESVVSELLLNIAAHGQQYRRVGAESADGRVEVRFSGGELRIATEGLMSEADYDRVRVLIGKYRNMQPEERSAQERQSILQQPEDGRASGMGLGLLFIVSDSKEVNLTMSEVRPHHVKCRIEATL